MAANSANPSGGLDSSAKNLCDETSMAIKEENLDAELVIDEFSQYEVSKVFLNMKYIFHSQYIYQGGSCF